MTSRFDQLLARARLVDEPYGGKDIDDAAARIAVRAARRALPQRVSEGRTPAGSAPEPTDVATGAARDLRTLCETAVADAGALAHLGRFLGALPEPCGARVLGCILQLTGQEDSARFWWQYAAGAGDRIATYCLYLQHLAHAERTEANWWHQQTDAHARPAAPDGSQDDVATTLRILRTLRTQWTGEDMPGLLSRLSQAGAVFDYIPAALSYTGDAIDLPLPDADFTDHISTLTAQPPGPTGECSSSASPPLPARTRPPRHTRPDRTPATSAWPRASRQWHDSGSSFGHVQRVGDITTVWRRELAWHMFFDHCDTCRDCDPAGDPCPVYASTAPSSMIDEIITSSPPPAGMNRRPIHCAPYAPTAPEPPGTTGRLTGSTPRAGHGN
ncbi:hypothetical protein ACFUTV_04245 [Streptomyces sp. NPDC057298]|uniref:hypothetical protein n=1 Tax=Streptomyces sp. NPDC057298 TaxID=3346091 RepID=UPI0036458D12